MNFFIMINIAIVGAGKYSSLEYPPRSTISYDEDSEDSVPTREREYVSDGYPNHAEGVDLHDNPIDATTTAI